MAQEKDERTTKYLDTVDIPPVINKGPRPGKNVLWANGKTGASSEHEDRNEKEAAQFHIDDVSAAIATLTV